MTTYMAMCNYLRKFKKAHRKWPEFIQVTPQEMKRLEWAPDVWRDYLREQYWFGDWPIFVMEHGDLYRRRAFYPRYIRSKRKESKCQRTG